MDAGARIPANLSPPGHGPNKNWIYTAMPEQLVEKYFGTKEVRRKTEIGRNQAVKFLANQIGVKADQVQLRENGKFYVKTGVADKMIGRGIDDRSFLAGGGALRDTYEMVEMGYNDIISGTLESSGSDLNKVVGSGLSQVAAHGGESTRKVLDFLTSPGVTEVATAAGAGLSGGIGLWLAKTGAQQTWQGLVRGDKEQLWNGARAIFLGVESTAASVSLASRLTQNALVQSAGAVAQKLAAPLAIIHGVVDVAQGTGNVVKGVQENDLLKAAKGGTEIGMGAAWLAMGLGGGPVALAGGLVCLGLKVGVGVLEKRRAAAEAQQNSRMAAEYAEKRNAGTEPVVVKTLEEMGLDGPPPLECYFADAVPDVPSRSRI